jgi:hypothetical protein
VLDDAKLSRGLMPGSSNRLGVRWYSLLNDVLLEGHLRSLLAVVVRDYPRLEPKIHELMQDDPRESDGNPLDPYEARLIGPGRQPMVDRIDLRGKLKQFLCDGVPVLVLRGPEQSGKSHSFELINHVTTRRMDTRVIFVDFAPPQYGTSAPDLMSLMCSRLGLRDISGRERRTTRTRFAAELVDDLVGIYKFKDSVQRVIVIDGLNRSTLDADVSDLIVKLVVEVVNRQLPRTQLVLAGYGGLFEKKVTYSVLTEDIIPITETHVRLYFADIGTEVGKNLSKAKLDALVKKAMKGAPNLELLGDRVRQTALELVEAHR